MQRLEPLPVLIEGRSTAVDLVAEFIRLGTGNPDGPFDRDRLLYRTVLLFPSPTGTTIGADSSRSPLSSPVGATPMNEVLVASR